MDAAAVALFAGLSRIVDLDSLDTRMRAIAGDLLANGWQRIDILVLEQWRDVAHGSAGESCSRWWLDPDGEVRQRFFAKLKESEANGIVRLADHPESRFSALSLTEGAGPSIVLVPLSVGKRVAGLVVLDGGAAPPQFDAPASLMLRSYCDIAASLFVQERHAMRAQRNAELSAVLARIGEHTRKSLDRRTMLAQVTGDVRDAFKAARCVFYERDPLDKHLAHVITLDDTGAIDAPMPRTHEIVPGSFLYRVFEHGHVIPIERLGDEEAHRRAKRLGMAALLITPIVSDDGRIDAAMSIHFARERTFEEIDLVLLRSIAMHLGLALSNAKLYESESTARRRAETLERNLRALRGNRRPDEILRTVCDAIVREFGACGSAWVLREGRFRCEAAASKPDVLQPSFADGTSAPALPEHLAALLSEDVILTRDAPALWALIAERSAMLVPLFVDQELWGFLAARIDLREGEEDIHRGNFLSTLSTHAALAIGNARAFEEQRRFAYERSVLSETGKMILTYNEPEELADAMSRLVLGLASADRACLYVPRDGSLSRIGCASEQGECHPMATAPFDDPVLGEAFRDGDTRLYTGLSEHQHLRGSFGEPVQRVAVLPLHSTDHVSGILACFRDGELAAPFDHDDVRLLESFCGLLGLGLRNCELYEAEAAANYALAESNEFKDDLLAMFTHDFKGPLTVILGYGELLLETETGEVRQTINTMFEQAKRLAKLSEDALLLARTQATGFALDRAASDLVPFVAEAVDTLDRGKSRISFESPEGGVPISIDRQRLRHVIDEVIGNALKYSTERIDVKVERGAGTARILVCDHGIGIPPGDLERIFTRFGRGANARRKGISGTGIGLYASRKIVEAHAGTIEVETVENTGSTFVISLPTLVGLEGGVPADRRASALP